MEAVKQTKKGLMRVEVLLYNFKASCSHPRKFKFNKKKKNSLQIDRDGQNRGGEPM